MKMLICHMPASKPDASPTLRRSRTMSLIAAEHTGRRCFAVELGPTYCDVAMRRWELATGRMASRAAEQDDVESPAPQTRKRA